MSLETTNPADYLPVYTCHKEVQAAKILKITDLGYLIFDHEVSNCIELKVNDEYLDKHKPFVGGYYVMYRSGYESFSPAEAFEDGYTRNG